jgi:hypothetical protein
MTYSTPAVLQAPSETPTALGGVTTVWTPALSLWIDLALGGARYDQLEGQRPVRIETATAAARDDPGAAAGQQLLAGADPNPWRVLAVQRITPGRMTLVLDRTA